MFKISLIEGIKNIDKNKVMTYLTVFLFAFLFLLQGYTYSYYSVREMLKNKNENETLQEYHLYALGSKMPPIQIFRMYPENIDIETAEYYEALEKSENITYVGIRSSGLYIENFEGDMKVFSRMEWNDAESLWCLFVTPNFYEVENYRVIEGRNFTAENVLYIAGKPRPVLLGYKYRELYDVGDILDISPEGRGALIPQIEVIGFLAEDTTVMSHTGAVIYDLDNYIVYPEYVIPIEEFGSYSKEVLENAINIDEIYVNGNIKIMFTEENEAEGLAELQTALDNYSQFGKYFTIKDVEYSMIKTQSRMESLTEFFALVTSVTMIFAVATVLISIANRVSRNMKDYAIHITVGATRGSTIWFIVAEMALILVCSMILGLIATKWMMYYINMPFYFWRFLGVYALTSVVILVLSAIVARIAMRKYDICTLIK
ncbi:MAG: hypothetical protein IJE51_04985 [Clostridia bacterium]|nr:hypothetical protein [Clostridia bacterium]